MTWQHQVPSRALNCASAEVYSPRCRFKKRRSCSRSRLVSSPGFMAAGWTLISSAWFSSRCHRHCSSDSGIKSDGRRLLSLRGTTSARRDGTVWGAPLVSELPRMIVVTLTQLIIRTKCRTPVGWSAYQKEPVCVYILSRKVSQRC